MKLSPPTNVVFFLATIFGVLGILAFFMSIPFVSDNKFWFEAAAFALLWAGAFFKGI